MYGGVAMVYPDTPLGVSVMSGRTVGGTRVFDRYDKHSTRTFPTTDDDGKDIDAPIDAEHNLGKKTTQDGRRSDATS